jgi:hypothetical protein
MVLQNMLIIASLQRRVHEQQRQWRLVFLLLLFAPAAPVAPSFPADTLVPCCRRLA